MASQDQNHLQQLLTDLRNANEESQPVGKKLRRLNEFVEKLSCKSCEEDVDAILATFPNNPNDFFNQRVKLELANTLKRPGPVIEALQSEERMLVNRAIQIRWIYHMKETFLTDPEFLLKDLFPNVSYVCRKRIIDNLGRYLKDTEKVEKIFQAVESKYGFSSAMTLLPSCGREFIENTLKANKTLRFSAKQLSQILQREPEVTIKYLQNYFERLLADRASNQYICSGIYSPTLAKLAKAKPQEFLKLYEKYWEVIVDLSLGPRVTNILLKTDKAGIIQSADKYVRLLHKGQILKRLTDDEFEKLIIALFPKSVTSFQLAFEIGKRGHRDSNKSKECIHAWLDHLQPKKQIEILSGCFEKVYNKKLSDYPEFFTSRIIKLLPAEEREKWIEVKLASPDGPYLYQAYGKVPNHREGFWTAYRSTEKSIPKIKEFLINESDVHRRADLVSFLVYSCSLNEDMGSLAEVLKFFVSRYRNDQVQVRSEFLETIDKRCDLSKLGHEHWQALNELLQLSSLNNEFSHYTSTMESILEKSIHFRLLHSLPIEPQIQHLIKIKTRSYCWGESWNILRKTRKFEKLCLLAFLDQLCAIYPIGVPFPSNSSLTSAIIAMAESMASWNKRHRNDPLSASEFSWLIARLKDILESDHDINKSRVMAALYRDVNWRNKYFDKLTKCNPSPQILLHFLKKNPEKISENMDSILNFMIHNSKINVYGKFLKKLRSQGLIPLKEQAITKALLLIQDNNYGDEDEYPMAKGNAIRVLSYIMKSEEFIKKISRYYPNESKIDLSGDDYGLKFETRKAVAMSLKNVENPSSTFTSLFRFCIGDYLKLVVGSLYSICYNSPESKALVFLKELVDRPVSVKKHAIRLVFTISHKEDIAAFLNGLWEAEKNPSIRHIIFQRIFQFFISEPTSDNWTLLRSSLLSLTTQDRDCLGELREPSNVDSIPPEFLSEYFKSCWEILSNISIMSYDTEWVKVNLLQRITPYNINIISKEFVDSLISSQLFLLNETDANLQANMISLSVRYLLHSPNLEIQSSRLSIVVEALKRLTGNQWQETDEEIHTLFPARQVFSSFIEQLCIQSFQRGPIQSNSDLDVENGNALSDVYSKSASLFKNLLETIETQIEPADVFTEYLFLQFAIICNLDKDSLPKENGDFLYEELTAIGKQFGNLVDNVVKIYNPEIIGLFSDTLKRFINTCYKYRLTEFDGDGGRVIHIVDGILHSTGSIDTKIVAAQLIPATYPKAHILEEKYKDVVYELRGFKDKSVRIFVNHRLTQSRPPEFFGLFD